MLALYPLRLGSTLLERALLAGFDRWPERGPIEFRFGRFADASLAPWPDGYRELWLHGVMEPAYTQLLLELLREGDVFVDGGANAGYFSLVAARRVAAAGRVFAFEPVPDTARALRANLSASHAANVEVVEEALAAAPGTLELRTFADDPSGCQSSVADRPGLTVHGRIRCRATTLDAFAAERRVTPTFIKIDIEGAELAALQGARSTIESGRAAVWVEYNAATAAAVGASADDVLGFLVERGYRAFLPQTTRGQLELLPFSKRVDVPQWSPMVLCISPGHRVWDRAVSAGLVR
jgi:FkbM family methyltransferase